MHNVYTVSQVNAYIKNMFTQDFLLHAVTVKGEVSNLKYHTSGHIYFTLKDGAGAIACVMFAGSRRGLAFQLKEGMQVQVTGSVDVYERDGRYQLYARQIEQDGAGQLYEKFEQLKRKLSELGMFAEEYKQPIPRFIRTLGVVTAPTGAAVRDIINISTRRNPYIQIILYPAIVQGDQAAASIVRGIQVLSERAVDVIIVGRGGGSIEDLWAFNEESVAEAIFNSPIPIISAVGHETDTTIADYVADLRAPTPSAAAELAVFEYDRFQEKTEEYATVLMQMLQRQLQLKKDKAAAFGRELALLSPMSRVRDRQMRAANCEDRLNAAMQQVLQNFRHQLALDAERMKGLSPLERLSGGYAYAENEKGENIRSITQVTEGDVIRVRVSDGQIQTKVTGVTGEI
ncbi:MAG: exodeoxyribonuclease VII large subunit [Butyrivibrio sp.]|nr:exodeoxyribonuclease VII large subunit [Butyrivibrio sp.]